MQMANKCSKNKACSSDTGFETRNSRTAEEWKEIVETVTLPDCKDDVENDDGIADVPPVPFHNEAGLLSHSSVASPYAPAEQGDEAIYKTYAAPLNKLLIVH